MCRPTKRPKPESQFESCVEQQPQEHFAGKEIPNEQSTAPVAASKQTFVLTTFDMVSNVANAASVGFDVTGTAVQIRDANLFAEHVLPKYFRHRNVTSFYRQLNSYGFRTLKTSSLDVSHTFVCDLFMRDRPDLLHLICRKKPSPPPVAAVHHHQPIPRVMQQQQPLAPVVVVAAPPPPPPCNTTTPSGVMQMIMELQAFQMNQQSRATQLEENIRRLSNENTRILQEGEHVIASMQDMVKNQTSVIHKLFGPKASSVFEAQVLAETSGSNGVVEMPILDFQKTVPCTPPMEEMDMFGNMDAMFSTGAALPNNFNNSQFVFPDEDLLNLETLLAFDDEDGCLF
jgi:hypothetical protein